MIKVLFVCLGNICRSPMAEAVFQHMVNQAGLSEAIAIDSAGTGGWHVGEPAHRGTLAVLRAQNIPYEGRARQFTPRDLDDYDYVLAMDRENLAAIQRFARGNSHAHVGLFLDYAYRAGLVDVQEVPDPYFDNLFDRTYDLIERGSRALLDHIRQAEGV